MQHPLSPDEHVAMERYMGAIRKQLHDICDLFSNRYGRESSIAEMAVKALVSTTLLEHELFLLQDNIGTTVPEFDNIGRSA